MIGNKEKVLEYLEKDKWSIYIIEKHTTKAGRTLAQNRTFYKIFKGIWDKLWYSKETVKKNILTALFWTYECKMFWKIHLIPNKLSTTELSKEEAIELITGALEYAKKIDAGIEIIPREVNDLYNSFNN